MAPLRVSLPWPHKGLNPNASLHWSERARLRKAARLSAYVLLRHAGLTPQWVREQERILHDVDINREPAALLRISVLFEPPDRRKRDHDNLIASMKAYFDGVSDACGINDYRFRYDFAVSEKVVEQGAVRLRLRLEMPQHHPAVDYVV